MAASFTSSVLECDPADPPAVIRRRPSALAVRRGLVGFVAVMVLGNLAIAGVSAWARRTTPVMPTPEVVGIKNFRVVDAHVWRGAAPSKRGYESLAAAG